LHENHFAVGVAWAIDSPLKWTKQVASHCIFPGDYIKDASRLEFQQRAVEVWFDLRQGGQICLPRITQPEAPALLILHRLGWTLPEQPPPRIYRDQSQFVGTT
jgi:hypothetical protein